MFSRFALPCVQGGPSLLSVNVGSSLQTISPGSGWISRQAWNHQLNEHSLANILILHGRLRHQFLFLSKVVNEQTNKKKQNTGKCGRGFAFSMSPLPKIEVASVECWGSVSIVAPVRAVLGLLIGEIKCSAAVELCDTGGSRTARMPAVYRWHLELNSTPWYLVVVDILLYLYVFLRLDCATSLQD